MNIYESENGYCNSLDLQEKIGRKENSIMGITESLISFVGSIMATFRLATLPQGCTYSTLGEERRRVLNYDVSIPLLTG